MFNSPFDVAPRQPEDPSPRYVKPIPANDLQAIFRPRDPVADDRPDLYAALNDDADEPTFGEGFWLLFGVCAALWTIAIYAVVMVLS